MLAGRWERRGEAGGADGLLSKEGRVVRRRNVVLCTWVHVPWVGATGGSERICCGHSSRLFSANGSGEARLQR